MKIVDLNVLVYAVNSDAAEHQRVLKWWEAAINDEETVGLPWIVLLGFLRISTDVRILAHPLTPDAAAAKLDVWLAQENVRVVREKDDHWEQLRTLVVDAGTAGNLTTDAHLAALALTNDAMLVSCDNDFARFKRRGLRWVNPLA
ncbi:MAG TPA: TA system VapC family ribonuclease toxin [Casimicrobiaceae bacterium]|nr:TA system VapC family ribonuclease toxin [Casimicrobiaceae bacterium]